MFEPIFVFIGLPLLLFVVIVVDSIWARIRKPKKNIRRMLERIQDNERRK